MNPYVVIFIFVSLFLGFLGSEALISELKKPSNKTSNKDEKDKES